MFHNHLCCSYYPTEQGSQTRGLHVTLKGVSCGQRCFLGNFQVVNIYLRYLVYLTVFKSARLASEQVTLQTNVEMARNDLPITHDAFCRK